MLKRLADDLESYKSMLVNMDTTRLVERLDEEIARLEPFSGNRDKMLELLDLKRSRQMMSRSPVTESLRSIIRKATGERIRQAKGRTKRRMRRKEDLRRRDERRKRKGQHEEPEEPE